MSNGAQPTKAENEATGSAAEEQKVKQEPLSFQQTLQNIARHLDSDDAGAQETACATLCMLLGHPPDEDFDLGPLSASLCRVLATSENSELQKNAAAALSAAIEVCTSAATQAVQAGAAGRVVQLLQGKPGSSGLVFNLIVVLSVLGAAGDAAAQSVLDAGGLQALLERCTLQEEEGLQEVSVDALCRLAAHSAAAKAAAVEQGAIPSLAGMLGSPHAEVRVRALLGLGMLLGEDKERQRQLALAPGAAGQLLALMRQQDDLDSQHIAGQLFRGLAANPELRQELSAAMRAAQQEVNEPGKFL